MNGSVIFAVLFAVLATFVITGCKGSRSTQSNGRAFDGAQTTPTTTADNTTLFRCDKRTTQVTQTSGTIRSPNFPRRYGTDQHCTWHVQVPRGFRIKVRFRRQFDIEHSAGCSKDYVMLSTTKQFRNPHIYCGSAKPAGITTAKNALWVRFHSDNSTDGRGFSMSYMAIDENECRRQVCTFPSLCRNTVGSYACDCPEGYANKGRKQAVTCEDIDECKINNGRCEHKCINTDGSYYCMCRRGYKQAADGRRCRDQNECSRNNGGCSHFCMNSRSSFRCTCPEGYALHSDKKTCYPEISFFHEQYTVEVSENTRPNTVVTKVEARTFPDKHAITYALLSENLKQPSTFTINFQTGEILVTEQLDRDRMGNYLLEVEASFRVPNTSGDGAQFHSARSYVLVNIQENGNNNALSLTQSSYYLTVPCNTTVDTTVYHIRTFERDGDSNTRLRFRFQRKLEHFAISSDGRIRSSKSLLQYCDNRPAKSFRTSVVVRDTQGVKRNAHAPVKIVIVPPGLLLKNTASRLISGGTDSKDTISRHQTLRNGQGSQESLLRSQENK